ncbi:hypothetical protein HY990_02885 [Candidatus Micrarchaeota archaeon]|nr:hypothetical protein [Candidatus Micrarchaeota archaeon]
MTTYAQIRDIQKRELESSAIVSLPEDFYQTLSTFLALKKQEAINSKSLVTIKEYENLRKIVLGVQSKREEKLVLLALRGDFALEGITKEEKELLKELSLIIDKSRQSIRSSWDNESSTPDDSLRVKLVQDVAQYKGLDNSVYGPYSAGSEQVLPKVEAEWLLKAKLAQLI